MLYLTLFVLILLYLSYYIYTKFYLLQKKSNIKGPSVFQSPFVLKFGQTQKVIDYLREQKHYKDFFAAWMGPIYIVYAIDPDAIKFVIREPRFKKIGLQSFSQKQTDYFGENLVGVDGDVWRRQRTIINNGFTNESLSGYFPTFLEVTEKALTKIPLDKDFEVTDYFHRFALDVLGKTVFNHDFGRIDGKNDKYYLAYKTYIGLFQSQWVRVVFLCPWILKLPIKPKILQDYMDGLDTLKEFLEEMIKSHRSKKDKSLLSRLLEAGNNPELLNDREIVSNVWVLFLAGHETTANALVWHLNCLRNYPDIQEKVYQEIVREIGVDQVPKEADIEKLVYLDCFIQEVLRLHNPIGALSTREATEDVPYKNMIIPKGARVGLYFHIVMTNPDYWEDPEKFDPERFTAENRKGRNHFLHIPFSVGPRQCIGNTFSLIEQKLFLVELLQKYRVVDPKEIKPFPIDRFLNHGGIPQKVHVRFEKR